MNHFYLPVQFDLPATHPTTVVYSSIGMTTILETYMFAGDSHYTPFPLYYMQYFLIP
jgi:hypothetical protein